MGFFSWKCAKSDKPVMSSYAVKNTPWEFASDVIVLFKNGDRISGTYDGYGNVNDYDILNDGEHNWRMVIKSYYSGETFEQLPQNKYDQGQGFFYDDTDLKKLFPNPQGE
jgi:hypothetical protein